MKTDYTKHQFIGKTLSTKLHTLGFNKPCFGVYDADGFLVPTTFTNPIKANKDEVSAILWQQAIDFFDERDIYINVSMESLEQWTFSILMKSSLKMLCLVGKGSIYETRNKAIESAIIVLINAHSNDEFISKSGLSDL